MQLLIRQCLHCHCHWDGGKVGLTMSRTMSCFFEKNPSHVFAEMLLTSLPLKRPPTLSLVICWCTFALLLCIANKNKPSTMFWEAQSSSSIMADEEKLVETLIDLNDLGRLHFTGMQIAVRCTLQTADTGVSVKPGQWQEKEVRGSGHIMGHIKRHQRWVNSGHLLVLVLKWDSNYIILLDQVKDFRKKKKRITLHNQLKACWASQEFCVAPYFDPNNWTLFDLPEQYD